VHGKLRSRLQALTRGRRNEFPFFDSDHSVVFFDFELDSTTQGGGVAARVLTYNLAGTLIDTKPVTQARDEHAANFTSQDPSLMSLAEFERQIKLGHGTEDVILADESALGSWTDEDDDDKEDVHSADWGREQHFETNNGTYVETAAPRTPHEIRSIPQHKTTPLLKRATSDDLADAKEIVANATAEAGRINMLRLAKPLRNTYGLKSGGAANATVNEDVKPLLEITDEIANAAALVAESSGASRNVTKRAVAGKGTYWMGSINRRGTVPWGDDPDYVVFRNVLDYGAVGDGVTVSFQAQSRCLIATLDISYPYWRDLYTSS